MGNREEELLAALKKAEDERDHYRAYLDAFRDIGIMAIDKDERILFANKASYEHDRPADGKPREITGMKFRDFSPEIVNSALLETCRTGEVVENREMEHSIMDIPRELGSAYPWYINGEFGGAVSLLFFNRWINNMINKTAELRIEYRNERRSRRNNGYTFDDILGSDRNLLRTKKLAMQICNVPSPVMIYGETGTGKELFAQSIHNAGTRYNKPFVGVNCAAIPETLLESTLFGTEKGAFTGAVASPGLIEEAGEGTLFLDEINSMPVELQVKLLRVIQEQAYRRVGGTKVQHLRCRILSATNRPPRECIAVGSMRDDLYYRLAAVQLNIPSLRERGADIIMLAENALRHYSEIYGICPELTEEVKGAFLNYNWPGNVRELNHVIESSMLLLENENRITLEDLPQMLRLGANPHVASVAVRDVLDDHTARQENDGELKRSIADFEKSKIQLALQRNDYNVSKTAKELGYSRSNLQYRMKKYDINGKPR